MQRALPKSGFLHLPRRLMTKVFMIVGVQQELWRIHVIKVWLFSPMASRALLVIANPKEREMGNTHRTNHSTLNPPLDTILTDTFIYRKYWISTYCPPSAAAEWSRLLLESRQTSTQHGCLVVARLRHLRHTLPAGDLYLGTTAIATLSTAPNHARLPASPCLPFPRSTMLDHPSRAYRSRIDREC